MLIEHLPCSWHCTISKAFSHLILTLNCEGDIINPQFANEEKASER